MSVRIIEERIYAPRFYFDCEWCGKRSWIMYSLQYAKSRNGRICCAKCRREELGSRK